MAPKMKLYEKKRSDITRQQRKRRTHNAAATSNIGIEHKHSRMAHNQACHTQAHMHIHRHTHG